MLPGAWIPGNATFYGDQYDTVQGSCGYGSLNQTQWPYWNAVALSPLNQFRIAGPQQACGECFEVMCDPRPPYQGRCGSSPSNTTQIVMTADTCPECQADHLDLQAGAFAAIAPPVSGIIGIQYRQVSCMPPGGIRVVVTAFNGPGLYMRVTFQNVLGTGMIQTVLFRGAVTANARHADVAKTPTVGSISAANATSSTAAASTTASSRLAGGPGLPPPSFKPTISSMAVAVLDTTTAASSRLAAIAEAPPASPGPAPIVFSLKNVVKSPVAANSIDATPTPAATTEPRTLSRHLGRGLRAAAGSGSTLSVTAQQVAAGSSSTVMTADSGTNSGADSGADSRAGSTAGRGLQAAAGSNGALMTADSSTGSGSAGRGLLAAAASTASASVTAAANAFGGTAAVNQYGGAWAVNNAPTFPIDLFIATDTDTVTFLGVIPTLPIGGDPEADISFPTNMQFPTL